MAVQTHRKRDYRRGSVCRKADLSHIIHFNVLSFSCTLCQATKWMAETGSSMFGSNNVVCTTVFWIYNVYKQVKKIQLK